MIEEEGVVLQTTEAGTVARRPIVSSQGREERQLVAGLMLPGLVSATVFGVAVLGAGAATAALAGLSVAVAAPLAVRRAFPLASAVTAAALAMAGGAAVPGWPGWIAAATAVGCAAYQRPDRIVVVTTASTGWFLAYTMATEPPADPNVVAATLVVGFAPAAVGYAMRLQVSRAEQARQVERAEIARADAEARARIAAEVHDAVGHHLTAIRMQATAARHVLHDTPTAAAEALGTIAELSSSALVDVRALVDSVRQDTAHPALGLSDVPALADRLTTSDFRIVVTQSGSDRALPAIIDHIGYRIVQEALTNAARHSRATEVQVRIERRDESVALVVEDDGPDAGQRTLPAEGAGIRGMRERVRQLGGSLEISARHPHGWRLRASLPVGGGQR